MPGPGDEIAPGVRARMRVSHADRDQVIGMLKTAFVQGRLAKDEFDLRVGQVLAARTYADLGAVTADIPAGPVLRMPRDADQFAAWTRAGRRRRQREAHDGGEARLSRWLPR